MLAQNRRSFSSILGDLMSDLGYAVSLICKFHRDCHRGPGRDIAITLVSRIWAPALLIFRRSLEGRRTRSSFRQTAWRRVQSWPRQRPQRGGPNSSGGAYNLGQAYRFRRRAGAHLRSLRSRSDSHKSYYGTNNDTEPRVVALRCLGLAHRRRRPLTGVSTI